MRNGDQVLVEYLDCNQGGVGRVSGTLGACVDGANVVTELVVETDGAATFIPVALVLKVTVEA